MFWPPRGPVPTSTGAAPDWGLQRDLLGDEAADREAEHINFLQFQRLDECDGVGAHFLERSRHLARTAGYARVVEQDHFSTLGQASVTAGSNGPWCR